MNEIMRLQQSVKDQKQDKNKKLLLVRNLRQFIINPPVDKILGFCPMFKDRAIIIAIKSNKKQSIIHIDQKGKIYKEHTFSNYNLQYSYIFPSNKEIIWLDVQEDYIKQWNIQTNQLVNYPFKFMNETTGVQEIFYFNKNQLICIAEWGRHDSNQFKLTYFSYPLKITSQKLMQYESEEVWNHDYKVIKGNQKSMVLWYHIRQKNKLSFRKFELQTRIYSQHCILVNKLKEDFNQSNFSVLKILEITNNKYMISVFIENAKNKQNNLFYIYNEDSKEFRRANFTIQNKYRRQILDVFHFGKTTLIKTFDFEKKSSLFSPIYYIDNQLEKIFGNSKWQCSNSNKYIFPDYDTNLFFDTEYQNDDVNKIYSQQIRIVQCLLITANFLDCIIPQIDRDLFQNVLILIFDL